MPKRQPLVGTSRSAGVGRSGLALAIALGSGWNTGIETYFMRSYPPIRWKPYPLPQLTNSWLVLGHKVPCGLVLSLRLCLYSVRICIRIFLCSAQNALSTHPQETLNTQKAPAMSWDPAVNWCRVWVSVSDIGRVGLANRNINTDEGTKPAHRVLYD